MLILHFTVTHAMQVQTSEDLELQQQTQLRW